MATKLSQNGQNDGRSQRHQRRPITLYDQHTSARFPKGRPWWGYIEDAVKMKDPISGVEMTVEPGTVGGLFPGEFGDPHSPTATWSAPWMPSEKYFRIKVAERKITIDYVTMIADYRRAMEAYYEEAVKKAYANGWDAPKFLGPISYQLQQVIGPMPMHPKVPEAAYAGDQWILGASKEPNELLQKHLDRGLRKSWASLWDEHAALKGDSPAEKKGPSEAQLAALAAGRAKRSALAEANASAGA